MILTMIHHIVMAGFIPAIHVSTKNEDVDARPEAGHDEGESMRMT